MKVRSIVIGIIVVLIVVFPGRWVARAALDLRVRYAMLHDPAVTADPTNLVSDIATLPAAARNVLTASPYNKGTAPVLLRSDVACGYGRMDQHTVQGRVSIVTAPFDVTYVVWVRPCGPHLQTYVFKIDADGDISADSLSAVGLNLIS